MNIMFHVILQITPAGYVLKNNKVMVLYFSDRIRNT